jgi:hypothetical protein
MKRKRKLTTRRVIRRRCAKVRSEHNEVHQSDNGAIIGHGGFQSTLHSESTYQFFRNLHDNIFKMLQSLLVLLQREMDAAPDRNVDKAQAVVKLHQAIVLAPFFKEFKTLKSEALCLVCITDDPRFLLKCGHSICGLCLKCFGTSSNWPRHELSQADCPICGNSE